MGFMPLYDVVMFGAHGFPLSIISRLDEGFAAYAVRGEVSSSKVEKLITHFVVTYNDHL